MPDTDHPAGDLRRLIEQHALRCWFWSTTVPRVRVAAVIVPRTSTKLRPLAAQSTIWGALRARFGDDLTIKSGRGLAQFVEPIGLAGTVQLTTEAAWPAVVCWTRAMHEDVLDRYRAGLRRAGLVMNDGVLCSTATRRPWVGAPADDPDTLWRLAMEGPCEP